MRFISTRNPRERATFAHALLRGMAPDGGLYVPEPIACFRDLPHLLELEFPARSLVILHRLLGEEFSLEELEVAVLEAFNFPVPLVRVSDRTYALELFHGPTLAFKDFGARFLAQMLGQVAAREAPRLRTVLTATSGDTGAAVAHAFWKQRGCRVVVLYPKGRVSDLQERQFATLGGNVLTYAVEGSFDDCQALVKGCFEDQALVGSLNLTAANSINVARLLAQILYYFEGVAQLRQRGVKDAPVLSVPCGNFGNLYAGLLAQAMGLPVKAFVVSCNLNRTVPDFLDTGEYRPRPSVATLSNAMDVGSPSNWERVQHHFQGDHAALREALRWGSLDDAATRRAMWELNQCGYLPDPHAAVAYGVLEERRGLGEPGIFLATAHPAKFEELLRRDMNLPCELPPALAETLGKPLLSKPLANDLEALKRELSS